MLPKVVVDDFGGTRSDPGMLGSGIYFASDPKLVVAIILASVLYVASREIHELSYNSQG